ncbi:MAG: ABC transporter substrate-binding protein [Methylotenera sp.]|nr:ABC transporter substrate-binding protein [Oligoflexia bacterium]
MQPPEKETGSPDPESAFAPLTSTTVFGRPIRRVYWVIIPLMVCFAFVLLLIYQRFNPAPPDHLVISTSDGEGDYASYARLYQSLLKEQGVDLQIITSSGGMENLNRLKDPKSDVDIGFVQDGVGSPDEAPNLVSLGSLYYEPIWLFYRPGAKGESLSRFSQFAGKTIAVGKTGGGTRSLSLRLLATGGISHANARLVDLGWDAGAEALQKGEVDAAIFLGTPDEPLIKTLIENPHLRLMSLDQAEAITRQIPYLHHLVLPHGAMDLKNNLPQEDIHLIAPTATLLVRDSLHPALIYLLLKAASQVHNGPGIFEAKNEFPADKDDQFPLSDDAKNYYKSGVPFWQKHLPFWLATLLDRFLLLILPMVALLLPVIRMIPRIMNWRVRSRIFQRYGELKFLETQIKPGVGSEKYAHFLDTLDRIEERVNQMKIPLDFSDHIYVLREHIDFVRARLRRVLGPGR